MERFGSPYFGPAPTVSQVVGSYRRAGGAADPLNAIIELRADGTFLQTATYRDGTVRKARGKWEFDRPPATGVKIDAVGAPDASDAGRPGPRMADRDVGGLFRIRTSGSSVVGLDTGEKDELRYDRLRPR